MPSDTKTSSTILMAKGMLFDMDRTAFVHEVKTPTLVLLLETLIEFGNSSREQAIADNAARAVMGATTRISEAVKARDG